MSLFMRNGRCYGVTLWLSPRIEAWCCWEEVPMHCHPGQVVEVLPVMGNAVFVASSTDLPRRTKSEFICRSTWLSEWLTIPAGWAHKFYIYRKPLIFLNRTRGQSPAENFKALAEIGKGE